MRFWLAGFLLAGLLVPWTTALDVTPAPSTLSSLGAAASGANGDITSMTALTAGGLPNSSVIGPDVAVSTLQAVHMNSAGATDGWVLTADGSGGVAWEAAAGGTVASSFTYVAPFTATQTSFIVAYATVTVTLAGTSPLDICWGLSAGANGVNTAIGISFMEDGAFIAKGGPTLEAAYSLVQVLGTTNQTELSRCVTVPARAAGAHSYAVTVAVNANTASVGSGGVTRTNMSFGVSEK